MTKANRGDHILKVSEFEYYAVIDGIEHGAWITRALALAGMKIEQQRKVTRLAKPVEPKRMKPDLMFLAKVHRGGVYPYYAKRGRPEQFIGGHITAKKHADAGFVEINWPEDPLMRGTVTLTITGHQALQPLATDPSA